MTSRATQQQSPGGSSAGPSVDRTGTPVVDPTANVLDLVDAAVRRNDDLLAAAVLRIDNTLALSFARADDLRNAEARRIDEIANLRDNFNVRLVEAESKRIDAIRAVDVNAVAVAAERSAQQATVLANQVAASAETLRVLVAQTASTTAQQLQQLTNQITERLALLEKSQYESKGRDIVANPATEAQLRQTAEALAQMSRDIAGLREGRSERTGGSEQIKAIMGYVLAVISILIALGVFALRAGGAP